MGNLSPASEPQQLAHRINLIYFSNEFPNDNLVGLFRQLYRRSKYLSHPVLARFLQDATKALRLEVGQLRADLAQLVAPYETMEAFATDTELRKGPLCGSIDGSLLCILQLATIIGHCELRTDSLLQAHCHDVLGGLGIGLLVSTAVAFLGSLDDLVTLGIEVLRIAFRLGIYVSDVSSNLEGIDSEPGDSWAYVIYGLSAVHAQQELDSVHAQDNIPVVSRIFISAFNETSVTISGPPSRLKSLFRSSRTFRESKHTRLPVFGGLCHAPHMYSFKDARAVVRASATRLPSLIGRSEYLRPVFSTSTGKPFVASTVVDLFEQVVFEIMTKPIEWDKAVKGMVDHVVHANATDIDLMSFRICIPSQQISSILRASNLNTQTLDLMHWLSAEDGGPLEPRTSMNSKIAIVGMSCRTPGGATDTEKFWSLLEAGLDVHRKIPADRFDVETHYDPTGKRTNSTATPYGCFIDEPGLFDAPFFNMSPREAEQTDPMQRLALVTAYEALERAGYVANRTPSTNLKRIGTWYGQASDDYREVNTAQEISTYFIPGGCRAFGPGRINYFFKFAGPSFNCDTACSSSLATIQAACTALWAGDVDTVVAGGVNVLTNSDAFAGLGNGHFLTKTPNACKTWDAEADGYCRADGVGSIVLKRLDDAERDNDNILGVILAAATNHSAQAVSITHPHAGHQADLYRQVMSRAGVNPLDVSYVELHGTGTKAGDAEEMKSVTDVFAPSRGKRRTSRQPLHIGAVKSNVGHGEAAAGVTALIKVLCMLQKSAIPPHVGIKKAINPGFPKDMQQRNLHIPFEKTNWPRKPKEARVAVINNFSAAGGNTTLAIEEAPMRDRIGMDPRPSHAFLISAKSKVSLKGNVERLLDYLGRNQETSLADLAYTLAARRHHHNHRLAIHAADRQGLTNQLTAKLDGLESAKPIPPTGPPPVAFAFTGQGAAEKSMSLQLYHSSPFFKSRLEQLDRLSQAYGFPSFIPVVDGSFAEDHSPIITQVAHVCTQIALSQYWESLGITPETVVGHSLGEYAALCVAGVLSAADAIFLVGTRAQMLESLCAAGTHKMVAVKGSRAHVQSVVTELDLPYDLACINAPTETVLSGTTEHIEALSCALGARGYKCTFLNVPFAFHSSQMDPILDRFEELARSSALFRAPKLPVISALLGKVIFDENTVNAEYMRRATRDTVDFLSAIESAQATSIIDNDTVWIEIGPHPVCAAFLKASITPSPLALGSFRRGEDNWTTLAQTLGQLHCAGVEIRWNEFHRPFESSLRLLDLPTYCWNDKRYWLQYNGNWALTKGNTLYDDQGQSHISNARASRLRTATVQQIVEEAFEGSTGKIVVQSNVMHPDFLAAAHGHRMNGCGVATQSIHADIAYTIGEYFYKKLMPDTKTVGIEIANLEVKKGLVAQSNTKMPQLIRITATTADIQSHSADLVWQSLGADGTLLEPFATCHVLYGNAQDWLSSWRPLTHLIQGRVEALEGMATTGTANCFTHKMAYRLFTSSLVDYAEEYRGMQAVVMNEFEAFADVTLKQVQTGPNYTVPPFFIDSVVHLAGFVMNVSDASDTAATFCITPGWQSMRFGRSLVAGGMYRSYVKMIPTSDNPSTYLGDVYILQDGEIVGLVGGIRFIRYPRILLSRFFSPPDSEIAKAHDDSAPSRSARLAATSQHDHATVPPQMALRSSTEKLMDEQGENKSVPASKILHSDSTTRKALQLIAVEVGVHISELTDDAMFANIGVDSLMSLVIAEKLRENLGVTMSGSLFLEYPTIGALRSWLEEYYS